MTCVVSVETREDGSRGEFRIVAGNKPYIASIENAPSDLQMLDSKFVPNSVYTRYLTRDLNFEDFCYRAAVEKKCLHSYAHPERLDAWFDMTFLPLDADEGNLSYCTYTMEINFEVDSERMSNTSGELASSVLATAIKLRGASDFKETMNDVIKDVRKLCEVELSCILLLDEDERTCEVLCEDVDEHSLLSPMEDLIDDGFFDMAKTWEDTIGGSNCLIAKDANDMEVVRQRNPRWHASLTSASVDNIVLFPLKSRGRLLGYVWVVNFEAERSGFIKEALELMTFLLASEIDNYLLIERMKVLSSRDMLCGVMNRNEMNGLVERLSEGVEGKGETIGVIFADVNGLKTVNDASGHGAGDALLRNASRALAEVFDPNQIFRAGGDEFAIFLTGVSQDQLDEKVEAIRPAAIRCGDVSFAIGYSFDESARNVRDALHRADELMYEDKRAYYREHPERRRSTSKDSFHLELEEEAQGA